MVARWTGTEEVNGMFKVLARRRELPGAEPNKCQYDMSSRKHRRSLGLLGQGKDPLGQFSRQFEITPVEANVRQCQENLHQLGIVPQVLAQLPRANEGRLTFRRAQSYRQGQ